ncbi:UvrABC system protein A [Geodia barretti]|uniref:UvrABC system protein A n=1 Tax=Geodia barretti TaxID=519541 RepID=A0AA35WL73_GEOBA|nr:UvrABC system protein A [Geodia barretti]
MSESFDLDKQKWHDIEVVVDRLVIGTSAEQTRVADSVETALKMASGTVLVDVVGGEELLFSEQFACVHCNISMGELEPRTFSFNNPHGACSTCTGLGYKLEVDEGLVIPNRNLSIAEGAVQPWARSGAMSPWYYSQLESLARAFDFSLDVPVKDMEKQDLDRVLYGTKRKRIDVQHHTRRGKTYRWRTAFEGVINNLERRYKGYGVGPCALGDRAGRKRKSKASRNGRVKVEHPSVLSDREKAIAGQILKEIEARLTFLLNVGLDYLTLSRTASTLSGGEAQRIRLATQIGSGLMGVLYVCDEPSIGLHPADDYRLIQTLKGLRDLGNTVLIVEHDEAIMRAADYIVDLGPGAGEHGGHIVATGPVEDIMAAPESITGQYLSGRRQIPLPEERRPGNGERLVIRGAAQNNLKDIDVEIPLGMLVCVTGVSGSGKSTLINEILYKKLAQQFYRARDRAGAVRDIEGVEHIDKGGRCEACTGDGHINIEMQFLPDVTVPCEICEGKRYNREALEIYWRGANIADVLAMTVTEALEAFENIPRVRRRLQTLQDVGLGYIRLGQPATQLSGGEAQRVKLAKELSKRATGKTLYILDEPTTGLSFEDCAYLLRVLHRLVDAGNTVVLIEHHLDMIKNADWLIDLGPGAGDKGGSLIAEGTPEDVARMAHSQTGQYLVRMLGVEAEGVVSAAD